MTDAAAMFTRFVGSKTAATQEEKLMIDILYNNDVTLQLGDKRLNNITALTWNSGQCEKIFSLLETSLNPEKYPWQTLHKSILLLHTITTFGSEIAIDASIQLFRSIDKLKNYNSALVKKGGMFSSGGTDYGGPVREAATALCDILVSDDKIREARQKAHESTESLVPMGEDFEAIAQANQGKSNADSMGFGQGMETSYLGAGFDLSHVPGMYENRPDRYFDDKNDTRQHSTAGDHQFTREALNKESLLDLVFDDDGGNQDNANSNLPEAQYLPALEKQKELERQLAEQQAQLQRLQMLAMQNQQQQPQQMNSQNMTAQMGQQPQGGQVNVFNDFQSMNGMSTNMQSMSGMNYNMQSMNGVNNNMQSMNGMNNMSTPQMQSQFAQDTLTLSQVNTHQMMPHMQSQVPQSTSQMMQGQPNMQQHLTPQMQQNYPGQQQAMLGNQQQLYGQQQQYNMQQQMQAQQQNMQQQGTQFGTE